MTEVGERLAIHPPVLATCSIFGKIITTSLGNEIHISQQAIRRNEYAIVRVDFISGCVCRDSLLHQTIYDAKARCQLGCYYTNKLLGSKCPCAWPFPNCTIIIVELDSLKSDRSAPTSSKIHRYYDRSIMPRKL
jgi:hypothetical protein